MCIRELNDKVINDEELVSVQSEPEPDRRPHIRPPRRLGDQLPWNRQRGSFLYRKQATRCDLVTNAVQHWGEGRGLYTSFARRSIIHRQYP